MGTKVLTQMWSLPMSAELELGVVQRSWGSGSDMRAKRQLHIVTADDADREMSRATSCAVHD